MGNQKTVTNYSSKRKVIDGAGFEHLSYLITAENIENPHTFLNFISTYGTLNS